MFKNIMKGAKPEAEQPPEPNTEPVTPFKRDRTALLVIQTAAGPSEVVIHLFSAMDGWRAKNSAKDFYSSDRNLRDALTLFALSHASIGDVRLNNESAVDSLLEGGDAAHSWENLQAVFSAVMEHNGIDIAAEHVLRDDIMEIGSQMSNAFWASAEGLIKPAIEMLNNGVKK